MKQLMQNNWKIKKLEEVCNLIKGKKPKNFVLKSNKPYLTAKVIRKIKDPEFAAEDCPLSVWVKKKDIVIIMDGSNSGEMFTNLEGALASTMGIVEYNKNLLIPKYLLYFLVTHRDNFTKSRTGAAIPHLNKEEFENLEIPLPPLPKQNRIVKLLDETFEKITQAKKIAEKNLENSKKLFESYLQDIFTNPKNDWKEKTLKEISLEFGRGKSKHRPRNDKQLFNGKYPFIQTGDVRNTKHYINNYSQTYNEVGLSQSKLWPKGTVCITIAANIAETAILNFDACFPDSIIGIIPDPKITTSDFVEYLLTFYSRKLKAKGKGSAQDNINMGTFENEYFTFPLLPQQKSIVKKLDYISAQTKKLESIYQQKLTNLEEFKKSILQKAFNGEL